MLDPLCRHLRKKALTGLSSGGHGAGLLWFMYPGQGKSDGVKAKWFQSLGRRCALKIQTAAIVKSRATHVVVILCPAAPSSLDAWLALSSGPLANLSVKAVHAHHTNQK